MVVLAQIVEEWWYQAGSEGENEEQLLRETTFCFQTLLNLFLQRSMIN